MPFRFSDHLYTSVRPEEVSPYKECYSSLGLNVKDLPQPMEALQDLHSAIAHHI